MSSVISKRTFTVAGNWKLHKTPNEAVAFLREMVSTVGSSPDPQLVIFPQALAVDQACRAVHGTSLSIGVQNINEAVEGAFTGEISARVARVLGCRFALIGHSERRRLFHETDEDCGRKILTAQREGLVPVLCVGETADENRSGQTATVLDRQLAAAFAVGDVDPSLVIAYEPVWAIGTGQVAMPEQAQASHARIRQWLRVRIGDALAERVPVWYGGSVKADNALELAKQPDIDGFLIGGAALSSTSLAQIWRKAHDRGR
jgi:triosephosphate isomerase